MTERVRAVKAKRSGGKTIEDQIVEEVPLEEIREREIALSRRDIEYIPTESPRLVDSSRSQAAAARLSPERKTPSIEKDAPPSARPAGRANDQIVEAALLRARRASETASRVAPPVDTASQTSRSPSKMVMDKEATAKMLELTEEVKPRSAVAQIPVTETKPLSDAAVSPEEEPPVPLDQSAVERVETRSIQTTLDLEAFDLSSASPIDDIEPRDYLAAEIKKVDRQLNEQFAHNESPPLFAHVVLNLIDAFIISLSSAPFLALIEIYNGSLAEFPTQIAGGGLVVLVTFFYLALTQSLCGRTFGMMLTNTRLVDSRTFDPPSPSRAMVRSAGYFVAALPALIGFIWLLFNRNRRGWHDYISGTMVARDF